MTKAVTTLRTVDPPWEQLVLICRKCSRKLDGGFGASGEESLRSQMKHALRGAGLRRRFRAIDVGCLAICPKNAVSVVVPSRPRQVLTVPAGTDPAAILALIAGPESSHETVNPRETPR